MTQNLHIEGGVFCFVTWVQYYCGIVIIVLGFRGLPMPTNLPPLPQAPDAVNFSCNIRNISPTYIFTQCRLWPFCLLCTHFVFFEASHINWFSSLRLGNKVVLQPSSSSSLSFHMLANEKFNQNSTQCFQLIKIYPHSPSTASHILSDKALYIIQNHNIEVSGGLLYTLWIYRKSFSLDFSIVCQIRTSFSVLPRHKDH